MRARFPLAAISLLAALAGSGDRGATTGAAPPVASAAGAFTLIATDAGFEAPDHVASGMRHIVYENHGTEIHEAMFIKLAPGMTARDYVAAAQGGASFPEGARDYSGLGLTSPGGKAELWVELDPGRYIIICWFRDHAETIPVHEFTVDDERRDDAAPPPPDVVVKLVDFRIDLEGELHSGPQVMRIEMMGPSMHELDLYRLDEGKTRDDLKAWYKNDQKGPIPGRAGTGILDSHDISRVVTIKQDLSPGHYVLQCQMPMSTDPAAPHVNVSHLDAGMVREVTIAP
jgi:hypothetical protein